MGKYIGAIASVVIVAGITLGIIAFLGQVGYFGHPQAFGAPASPAVSAPSSLKHATLGLEIFPASPYTDPGALDSFKSIAAKSTAGALDNSGSAVKFSPPGDHPDWVTYWPTTRLVVPAHALVTVSIYNWDSKSPLLNEYYSHPVGTTNASGTADNSETVLSYDDKGAEVNSTFTAAQPADPKDVSHTFTFRPVPGSNSPYLFVSVPVIGVADNADADDAGFPKKPVVTTFTFETKGPGVYHWNCFDPCGNQFDNFGGAMQTFGYMSGDLVVQ